MAVTSDDTIRASRYLITTPVTAELHPRCGTLVLTGHAEGLRARVDTAALNPYGEAMAILAGERTYSLTVAGLVHRDPNRIRDPWLSGRCPVVTEHRCRRHIPATHRAAPPAVAAAAAPDTCPY